MNGLELSLSQFPILAGLDGQIQQAIAERARERTYFAGQMIALAGESSQAVYLVAQGRLRSQRFSMEGREYVLHDLGPGECFNLASALDGGHNLSTVTATSDVVLYAISVADFRRILAQYPALSLALLSHLTRRVRHLSDAVEGLALYDVRIRLARCLLGYTGRHNEGARASDDDASRRDWLCPSYLTQGELAAQIGTVRDVVGRTLRSFTREGLIRRERGRMVITDLAGLRREALHDQHVRLAS
jgi:CRP-like cAMP-binding protein